MGERWYVALARTGLEDVAVEDLRKQGFSVYAPRWETLLPGPAGRARWTERMLFAPYLFVELDVMAAGWESVNSTRGVVHLLPLHNATPEWIPLWEMERLQSLVKSGVISAPRHKRGDIVQILEGAFAGYNAVFEEEVKGALKLILALLGRRIELPLPPRWVSPPPAYRQGGHAGEDEVLRSRDVAAMRRRR